MKARFIVRLTCCGSSDGEYRAATWHEADRFREAYLDVDQTTHERSAIVERVEYEFEDTL